MQSLSPSDISRRVSGVSEFLTPSSILTPNGIPAAGNNTQTHYIRRIGSFRNSVRNLLLPIIRWETPILGKLQARVRSPFLDVYFTQTANLGSHTFYVLLLPISFWFGFSDFGSVLVFILAAGVYMTNFLKDFCCLPRPLSPPLHRLTMSKDAALEYGFPSTHTANAISVSLFFMDTINSSKPNLNPFFYYFLHFLNCIYIFSLVAGRIYCGMHGFLDLFGGALIGSIVYFWGAPIFSRILFYITWSNTYWALAVIPIVLILIRIQPEPADDCPCFEDSVAFLGVLMGQYLGEWQLRYQCYRVDNLLQTTDRASLGAIDKIYLKAREKYILEWGTLKQEKLTPGTMLLRFILGSLLIGVWKVYSKKIFHIILPPLWRRIEKFGLSMPRRFYVPASQYDDVPSDKIPDNTVRIFPILVEPDSSDNDSECENSKSSSVENSNILKFKSKNFKNETVGPQSTAEVYEALAYREQQLNQNMIENKTSLKNSKIPPSLNQEKIPKEMVPEIIVPRVHYDVEVITKLLVYAGISAIALYFDRILFSVLNI
ncbi:uncharacterized protein SAPINGB_P003327 [Magnusiomyces paraingens]|uniref:Phosphatidic acid phosphatase type 2/haloperoxidase domain-containing protein n=1 Tax=Magnusiomyces paraingens TaxID=2606893 RepID=A0A5E8BU94_9ASCO|nr:uncharacterized protein SAPINGB_P003327 [Saprochaete ingens]VVT52947.1 unnamed protein product [Saprochaete ingens]